MGLSMISVALLTMGMLAPTDRPPNRIDEALARAQASSARSPTPTTRRRTRGPSTRSTSSPASKACAVSCGSTADAGATTLLAVGNPVVRGDTGARTRQVDLAAINLLTPLPHSAEEMSEVAALFKPRARVLEAAGATEQALRTSGLDGVRILHFATHGLIDEIHTDRSGLVLTAAPPQDDGLLRTREIYTLPLRAQLVTLSACQTALGRHVTGEGIIGLTRAFFCAGARAVVASLWDIEDASTARLMQRFYANIRDGEPIDVALQHAKIAFLHGGGASSRTFYWASFVVSGQARSTVAIARRGGSDALRSPGAFLSAIALAALIAAVLAWLYRKRAAGRP